MSKISNWWSFVYVGKESKHIHMPWNMQMGKAAEQQQKVDLLIEFFSDFLCQTAQRLESRGAQQSDAWHHTAGR